jgi:hypothetical protein
MKPRVAVTVWQLSNVTARRETKFCLFIPAPLKPTLRLLPTNAQYVIQGDSLLLSAQYSLLHRSTVPQPDLTRTK